MSFSLFISPTDKRVFEYISSNPGSYLMDISNNIDISVSSAYSILKRLLETDIVRKLEFKGKTIYYPKGLRSDDVERAFSQLKHINRKMIFLFVLDNLGCRQKEITDEFGGMSIRQVRRHLDALVEAELLTVHRRNDRSVKYTLGRVGEEIVLGSFERIDPFLQSLREKTGSMMVTMVENGRMIVDMINGDSIAIELGKWKVMNIDDETIYQNKYAILGDGGEKTLIAIYNGSDSISSISMITGLPEKIVKAKIGSLSIMGIVANFGAKNEGIRLTTVGKSLVEKILKIS